MKRVYEESKLEGFGGWLALLQVRMVLGLALLLVMPAHLLLAMPAALALAWCLALLYRRCAAFCAAYVVAAALGLAAAATALHAGIAYILVLAALEAAIIPALFRSRRLKNTLFRRWGSCTENLRGEHGWFNREQNLFGFDEHFIAKRSVR
jgi:hypothetical protein